MLLRRIAQLVSWTSLAATLALAIAYFRDAIDLPEMKKWMLVATIVWFVATPIWMGRAKPASAGSAT
jgi:hypothetical protein